MISVYYDDKCPICQSEIEHFSEKYPDRINPIPITYALDELKADGISEIDALTYLHAKDETGKLYKSMDAVRLLYRTCDSKLALIVSLPIIKECADMFYPIFARHRYKIPKWISYAIFGKPKCENGVCYIDPKNRINQ